MIWLRAAKLRAWAVAAICVWLMASCAIVPRTTPSPRVGEDGPLGRCADFFYSLDQRASEARVLDPGAFRIDGFPYMRVDRFLASFRAETREKDALDAWVRRMQALDAEARGYEIANLPRAVASSPAGASDPLELTARVSACGELLRTADLQSGDQLARLRANARAPDEYLLFWRAAGLYPLTRWLVSYGVSNWHAEARPGFSTKPPAAWRSTLYFPESRRPAEDAHLIVSHAKRDALGIPVYPQEAQAELFRAHAPVWEVRTEAEFDRIGAPRWASGNALAVDTGSPTAYTLLTFTRFGGQVLTQLHYVVWFPARPKQHALDIYGGFLDGVTYRVTLDGSGEPLLYETVHNCGCYYQAYPTHRLTAREAIDYAEPPLILAAPALDPAREIMTVAMESRTHYVRHLYPRARQPLAEAGVYPLADYGGLRSLPHEGGGRRSMFGPDSLVPGSERLERFLLWPTGVVSPGAMRQAGRHAVAFVGERHFDDPFALERMFIPWMDGR